MSAAASSGEAGAAGPPGAARRTPLSLAAQVVGFVVSLGLLGWVGYRVLSNEQSRAQLGRLWQAPIEQLLAMLLLSGFTIALSGLVFWAVVRPARRLSAAQAVGVNSVCSALSYLPFKISLIFRVLYHHRRDRLPLLFIGAWLAAAGVVILTSIAPPLGMSLLLRRVDGLWWAGAVGGTVALGALLVVMGRWAHGARGRAFIDRAAAATRVGLVRRFVNSAAFGRLMEGAGMLGDWRAVFGALALRSLDVAAQAARFALAAHILGVGLSADQVVIAGVTYFLLQATAPTGVGGVREAGTAGLLGFLGNDVMVVVIAVSAAEAAMNLLMGAAAAVLLRVDKLLVRGAGAGTPAEPLSSPHAAGTGAGQPDGRRSG